MRETDDVAESIKELAKQIFLLVALLLSFVLMSALV